VRRVIDWWDDRKPLFIAAVVLLLAICVLAVFRWLSPGQPRAIFSGALAITLALLTQTLSSYLQKRREIEISQRQQKIDVYSKYTDILFKQMFGPIIRKEPPPSQSELTASMSEFTKVLVMWGGDDSVRAYADLKKWMRQNPTPPPLELLHMQEQLLFAFRRDIGYANRGLKAGDLLGAFIKDLPIRK